MDKGNAPAYSAANTPALPDSPLAGKRIIFLGSSVTAGSRSMGEAFPIYLAKRYGILPVVEAVSGTTLTNNEDDSYIPRMKTLSISMAADAFVCQLSTNDATRKLPLGQIAEGTAKGSFDTGTITGSMEYIIAYARKTWGCPVIFYTGTRYDSPEYEAMVRRLLELQQKWGIGVIDLWNDPQMNAVSPEDYALYMYDSIHPTRAGYRDWWTPKFASALADLL